MMEHMYIFKMKKMKKTGKLIYFYPCDICKGKAIYKFKEEYYCKKHMLNRLEKCKLNYPLYRQDWRE